VQCCLQQTILWKVKQIQFKIDTQKLYVHGLPNQEVTSKVIEWLKVAIINVITTKFQNIRYDLNLVQTFMKVCIYKKQI